MVEGRELLRWQQEQRREQRDWEHARFEEMRRRDDARDAEMRERENQRGTEAKGRHRDSMWVLGGLIAAATVLGGALSLIGQACFGGDTVVNNPVTNQIIVPTPLPQSTPGAATAEPTATPSMAAAQPTATP